jgi:CheY-like chemotaxis protein
VQTIVIVEDDADTRTIYLDALEERGYRVYGAKHGAEGVTVVRRHHADLVLLDIRMPVMDGWQALGYLKADPKTATIPVWGMSAYLPEEETREHSMRLSFDRLVPKPIAPRQLVAEIEEYLGPPERRPFR